VTCARRAEFSRLNKVNFMRNAPRASESWKCGQGNPPVKQSKNAEMTCAMAYAMAYAIILPVHIVH
jgi:hypothetical protein